MGLRVVEAEFFVRGERRDWRFFFTLILFFCDSV
jgi:hypothetical protein